MKRMILILTACSIFFAGCASTAADNTNMNNDTAKKSRIEIYSMQGGLLSVTDDQDTINNILNSDKWSEAGKLPEGLTLEYKLPVSQEKTLLAGQDPDEERDYELIETIVLFQNSAYAAEEISGDVVKNADISSDLLTVYYELPDSTLKKVKALLEDI